MRGARNPKVIDFVTWGVGRGVRLFQRVHVTDRGGLEASQPIARFDFPVLVPAAAVHSFLRIADDAAFPRALRVAPANYAAAVRWWPDLNWGSLCLTASVAKTLLSGAPAGPAAYLALLPLAEEPPLAAVAREAMRHKLYKELTAPLAAQLNVGRAAFDDAFCRAYCLVRTHGTPIWSRDGTGHPLFEATPYAAAKAAGDVVGMVPFIDGARHSAAPNCCVGVPDAEMRLWLSRERSVAAEQHSFVLQATRDIRAGEALTVDKNASYGFEEDAFAEWFGYPYRGLPGEDEAPPAAAARAPAAPQMSADDLFD
jgi:hypothetical protein